MHIGIEGHGFWGEGGSLTRYACQLVRALARIDRRNRYTVFFNAARRTLPGQGWFRELLRNESFSYVLTRIPNVRSPLLRRFRERILWPAIGRRLGVELFHSTVYLKTYDGRIPSVLTVHDVAGIVHAEHFPDTGVIRRHNARILRDMRRSDVILTSSQNTCEDVRRLLAPRANGVRVVLLGVDREHFRERHGTGEVERILERYGIRAPYILHVGDLVPRKNLPRLVRAFARLRAGGGIPHQLVLAGNRNYGPQDLFELPAELGCADAVRFPGFVAEDDLPALYSGASVFAYPSFYEGFGFPALEAMACGTPIVCSHTPAVLEVVGDAALTADPQSDDAWHDALDAVIHDERVRAELQRRSAARIREFSWDRTAIGTLEAYRALGAD